MDTITISLKTRTCLLSAVWFFPFALLLIKNDVTQTGAANLSDCRFPNKGRFPGGADTQPEEVSHFKCGRSSIFLSISSKNVTLMISRIPLKP